MAIRKKSSKKVITLSKPYLVEGKIYSKGTRILIETEDYVDDVYPTDATFPEVETMTMRRFRRMDDPYLGEDDELDSEITSTMKKLRRLQRMKRMDMEDEMTETDDNDEDDIQSMRRFRRRLHRMDTDNGDDGTLAGNEAAFESEIENSTGDIEAMRRMSRMSRMSRMQRNKKCQDSKEKDGEDNKED